MSSISVSSLVLGSLSVEVDGTDSTLALSVLGTAPASLAIELGTPGAQGPAATIAAGTTTTLSSGSAAYVTNVGTSSAAVFNFGVPQGPVGATGASGSAATVTVGTTTTGAAGSSASVVNAGSSSAAVLNFTIPRGDKGETGATGQTGSQGQKGDKGDTGAAGAAATITLGTVSTGTAGSSVSITNSGTSSAAVFNFSIPRGDKGDQGNIGNTGPAGAAGAAATISVGSTTTGAAGSSASVSNSGTSSAAVFNFTIPRGDKGDTGNTGATGATGAAGAGVATGGSTGQYLQKLSGTNYDTGWSTIVPGDRYLTTSTTSLSIGNGTKTLTVGTGLSYSATQDATIARTSDPTNYHMHGKVTSYNSGTGELVLDVQSHTGTGTYSAWTVNVGGLAPNASVAWGDITGTLSSQTDLQTALDGKLSDAPSDGYYYMRKDAAWEQVIIS
jgi:hypothetical protein